MKKLLCLSVSSALVLLSVAAWGQVQPGSIVVGAPTGGNQGYGSINAQSVYVNGVAVSGGGGSGTVTSAGLTVPGGGVFGVTGSPITTSGTFAVSATGTSGQYLYFCSVSTICSTSASTVGNIINVLMPPYSFVCDGATDNGAAMTSLNAALAANDTVYFPPQTNACLTSVALTMPSNSALFAYPGTAVLKATSNTSANPLLLQVTNSSNVEIYGITLDGGGLSQADTNNVASVYQSSGVVFDTCRVQNTSGVGVAFSGGGTTISDSGVKNCAFTNIGGYNTTVATLTGAAISGSTLTFSSAAGTVATGQVVKGSGVAYGTTITAGSGTSWTVTPGGQSVSSETMTTQAARQGLVFCCGSPNLNNFAINNYLTNVGLDAISIANQTSFNARGNSILQDNVIGACIYASSNTQLLITGNVCRSAGGNGIDSHANQTVSIAANSVSAAGASGISSSADVNATITGNALDGNYQGGNSSANAGIAIAPPCASTTVAGNVSTDSQGTKTQPYGISTYSGSCTGLWVDASNNFAGNLTASFGGTVYGYSVPSPTPSAGIPFIIPSSGTMGNNGALSGITALAATYTRAYVYMPANAISSGSAAGWYWGVGSSTTAFTLYNNTYTSGTPVAPASPTAFSTTGPGAYTQTTSEVAGPELTIPGNSLGANGFLEVVAKGTWSNNADVKTIKTKFGTAGTGGTQFNSYNPTTTLSGMTSTVISNRGATNIQVGNNQATNGYATSTNALLTGTVDTTANQTLTISGTITTAVSDYLIIEAVNTRVSNSP